MTDFKLLVREPNEGPIEIEKLRSDSKMTDLVRAVKEEFMVEGFAGFSLQYSDGFVFYQDEKRDDHPNREENETLEEFFKNAEGAEILYVEKKAGPDDIKISNATDEDLIAVLDYETINPTATRREIGGGVEGNLEGLNITGNINTDYTNLDPRSVQVRHDLPRRKSGYSNQISLRNGLSKGSGAVGIAIYRKKDQKFTTKLEAKPGRIWILYPSADGGVSAVKSKWKSKIWFFKRQHEWVDKDGVDHDPLARAAAEAAAEAAPEAAPEVVPEAAS